MTDDDYLRLRMDMINRNSTYGLPKEDEDKIVKISHDISMIWCVDQREIAKIIHDFMKKDICRELDSINCPKQPIYIGPVKCKSLKERLEEVGYDRRGMG